MSISSLLRASRVITFSSWLDRRLFRLLRLFRCDRAGRSSEAEKSDVWLFRLARLLRSPRQRGEKTIRQQKTGEHHP